MRSCCTTRSREEDDTEDGGLFAGLWRSGGSSSSRSNAAAPLSAADAQDAVDERLAEERSTEMLRRHVAAVADEPNLLLYSVSDVPCRPGAARGAPRPGSPRSPRPPRPWASHIPPNTLEGVPIETEYFKGDAIVMYRPAGGLENSPSAKSHPYLRHFIRRKRNWEFRVQGRFKRIPTGDMFIGIVLRDFNYDQAVARHSMLVKRMGMALVKYDMYLSWGDRCEASKKPDAELSHLVTNMTAWDLIIVTPEGKKRPLLRQDLHGLGEEYGTCLERKDMGLASYSKAVEGVTRQINTKDLYTMSFWGVSPVIDLLGWQFKIGASISMARFFEDCPIHVSMYELERREAANGDKRHLESQKRYYIDFMFWSNAVSCPKLPQRYKFVDAPVDVERRQARIAGGSSSSAEPRGRAAAGESGRPSSLDLARQDSGDSGSSADGRRKAALSSWLQRLRWIPTSTCAGDSSTACWKEPARTL